MSEPDRRSSWTFLLVGLALLVVVPAVVIGFVPIAECPNCNGKGEIQYHMSFGGEAMPILSCRPCAGRGKLSLFKKWTYRTAEAR